ncbi:hypothetical protein [Phnomibacter ginsenosidimutans]|uniref:Glycosyltransferase RgtA/B/C/D-like domain-containing protein n=1 Tax=Phnomibacter ginsenosidimutans TaxID=2676868 RepID=A0A6I6GKI4_9BACT|nr:hypothetical protein [Phnomibacter ginsenosidimutans]QGW28955.1 hypothetical protein GLV81_13350 [Phnomibacter ginsenosidimutans]
MQASFQRTFLLLLVIVLATAVGAWFSLYNNFFSWDLIPYLGVVLGYDGMQGAALHQAVFTNVQQLPADVVPALLHEVPYREQCLNDASFFEAQLGFYRVKPLFTGMVYAGYKAGLHWWTAMRIPGIIGFAGMATVLYLWVRRMVKPGWDLGVTTLLLFGYATQLARLTTPDALASFLTLTLFYVLFWHGRQKAIVLVLLLLLTLTRIDLLLLCIPVLLLWWSPASLTQLWKQHLTKILIAGGLLLILAFIIPMLFGNSWEWYFNYSMTQSLKQYVVHAGRSFRQLSGTWLPLFFVLLLMTWPVQQPKWPWLLGGMLGVIAIRWLLFPAFQERFFVGYEMVMACYLLQVWQQAAAGCWYFYQTIATSSSRFIKVDIVCLRIFNRVQFCEKAGHHTHL